MKVERVIGEGFVKVPSGKIFRCHKCKKDIYKHSVLEKTTNGTVGFEATLFFPKVMKDDKGKKIPIYSMCYMNGKLVLNVFDNDDEYEIILKKKDWKTKNPMLLHRGFSFHRNRNPVRSLPNFYYI